ncbi:MAG: hypothetical protein MUC49_12165 [Raineya sp.]|jgi:hypothetical protein|nr:hypothetical protein [Raineya sp.]
MNKKVIHYFSGIFISLFVGMHLFNHVWGILGAEKHIALMNHLRVVYRNPLIETLLLLAVLVQIISGLLLFKEVRKKSVSFFNKLHVYSGLYLAIFLIIHVSAILGGRLVLKLDTNFYFGVAGLNTFPLNLFFIPYYGLAVFSFFGHIAAIHSKKMQKSVWGVSPVSQSKIILIISFIFIMLIFYGVTNGFQGVNIPKEYKVLVGN